MGLGTLLKGGDNIKAGDVAGDVAGGAATVKKSSSGYGKYAVGAGAGALGTTGLAALLGDNPMASVFGGGLSGNIMSSACCSCCSLIIVLVIVLMMNMGPGGGD